LNEVLADICVREARNDQLREMMCRWRTKLQRSRKAPLKYTHSKEAIEMTQKVHSSSLVTDDIFGRELWLV
jgi:peptidyl-tRNA hydrolase